MLNVNCNILKLFTGCGSVVMQSDMKNEGNNHRKIVEADGKCSLSIRCLGVGVVVSIVKPSLETATERVNSLFSVARGVSIDREQTISLDASV